MLKEIRFLLKTTVSSFEEGNNLLSTDSSVFQVDHIRQKDHGDIASNIALVLAKQLRMKPLVLANRIVNSLPFSPLVDHVV